MEFHIEELVLDGFAPGDRQRIGDGLQEELAGLLEANEISEALQDERSIEGVDAGSVHLRRGAGGKEIGREAARAVNNSLSSWTGTK